MVESRHKILSACLVVYNEELTIQRCLESIKDLVDEIIVVHDGPCGDRTLEIAKNYTDKIFIRSHIGIAEPHRAFSFEQATGEWILQMDADEYIDKIDREKIRSSIMSATPVVDAFIFKWEMWNGVSPVYFDGLQKMCLFRKKGFFTYGLPNDIGYVFGKVEKVDFWLRHRPIYDNISWREFFRKNKKWIPIHADYFFPEKVKFECFNTTPDLWIKHALYVRKHIWFYVFFVPFKMSLGQLKNGLWKSRYGFQVVLERYVYFLMLYWLVRVKNNALKISL